ncbi:MAG: hypothetical protein GF353_22890 [Candidatus Lokiarchaeota archaeon]|nr:hypothetical protein [Candidatus Lokiarchaeota archaeon]
MSELKPVEPVTLVTDLILAIEGFLFALFLIFYWTKKVNKKDKPTLMWIGGFLSVGFFALFGALSHGTEYVMISEILWPPTMVFGGISFIFFVAGTMIYQKEENYGKMLLIPVVLVLIYLIVGFLINWPFFIWVLLLLVCSVLIYFYAFKAKKENKLLSRYLFWGLTIIIIAGIVQGIGGIIGYRTYFGPNNQYLFTPHNDIFHIIAMVGLLIFFVGFRRELFRKSV